MIGPAERIVAWQRQAGRHDFPWQRTRDPYRVWLSEIMLQQTQVQAVLGYYERFLARCPDVFALAEASSDEVMALWAGLGYYSRARNLHACAKVIVERHGGRFPDTAHALAELPGVGRSTAAAIAAFCFAQAEPILDGNVKRVLARVHAVPGWPGLTKVERQLWLHAHQWMEALIQATPAHERASALVAYTQGLMDLGATVCKPRSPACGQCPVHLHCQAYAQDLVDSIPSPRPSKVLPTRFCVMWIVRSDGGLLLERQAPPGIWGGLWAPPRDSVDPTDWPATQPLLAGLAALRALQIQSVEPMLVHGFSHFKLHLLPVLAVPEGRVSSARSVAEPHAQESLAWFDDAALSSVGIPAPVRKLLARLKR